MHDEEMKQRVLDTKWDHYPLNKMLPQSTVFNMFFQIYNKEPNKKHFLNNHEYLKLREGYFALIACKAFDDIEKRDHYLQFTDEHIGDVAFLAEVAGQEGMMEKIQFDVKEYHEADKKDFFEYLEAVGSKPKVRNNEYGLIIGLNRDVKPDARISAKLLDLSKGLSRGVFICSADPEFTSDPTKVICQYLLGGNIVYTEKVTLTNNGISEMIIFQDTI